MKKKKNLIENEKRKEVRYNLLKEDRIFISALAKNEDGTLKKINYPLPIEYSKKLPTQKDKDYFVERYNKENPATKTKEDNLTPFFYDSHGIFWLWNQENFRWGIVDDVDVLNMIEDKTGADITKAKVKGLLLNFIKQRGRRNKPKDSPKSWVQFKDKIFDLKTNQEFTATPKYFITNPLPYKIGNSEETPTIDKLFRDWVICDGVQDESWVNTLYEIVAYCCCQEQFLQRIIALTGAGSNGKGTFLNLIAKFIGTENICSSNLRTLSTRNFESSALYKKLVCFFGEVDSSDLTNTNQIKSLTGEDLIRFEFKGKTPFSESSGTTPIIATNSLPITPDKSDGFYRRWLIPDFPNQFEIKRNLIGTIPEVEFENLSKKIVRILKELYVKNEFTNEGTIKERAKRYEERSNPINIFIRDFCEDNGHIKLKEFSDRFNKYLKERRLRPMTIYKIGKQLREEGFEIQPRNFKDGDKARAIIGLNFKGEGQSIEKKSSSSSYEREKLLKLPEFTIEQKNLNENSDFSEEMY